MRSGIGRRKFRRSQAPRETHLTGTLATLPFANPRSGGAGEDKTFGGNGSGNRAAVSHAGFFVQLQTHARRAGKSDARHHCSHAVALPACTGGCEAGSEGSGSGHYSSRAWPDADAEIVRKFVGELFRLRGTYEETRGSLRIGSRFSLKTAGPQLNTSQNPDEAVALGATL